MNDSLGALAGQYQLRPGVSPALLGQRPVVLGERLGRWLQGQSGATVVHMLGLAFSVCGHAHRLAARLALSAASTGQVRTATAPEQAALHLETARDHLRTLALDWPAQVADPGDGLQWLAHCPLALVAPAVLVPEDQAQSQLRALGVWWETSVLREPLHQWLQRANEPAALLRWCATVANRLPSARCLLEGDHSWRGCAPLPCRTLSPFDVTGQVSGSEMATLGEAMLRERDFAAAPAWRGAPAETGAWARAHHGAAPLPDDAWGTVRRLAARWIECVQLGLAPAKGAAHAALSCGAVPLGAGQAVAWCEMARGLLVHAVHVDETGAVQGYRVLAPTDWNFAPNGALAQAVGALRVDQWRQAQTLAWAYDACVPCSVQRAGAMELEHA